MILTRTDRIIVDNLPKELIQALNFFTWNSHILTESIPNTHTVKQESFSYFIEEYTHKDNISSHWRSHRQYIYVYIIISGEEIMDINDISELQVLQQYNSKSDQILYSGYSQTRIRLIEKNIVVLYPEDAYRIHYHPNSLIKKCVIKIPLTNSL